MTTRPTSETYDDVVGETIRLAVRGGTTTAFLYRPARPGLHPAVVVGAEGTGVNSFIRRVAATLAHLGYVTIVADYYRGGGPADPEDYSDVEEMMRHIHGLDFRRAVQDVLATLDYLQEQPDVDASRVASWGYCTGATLAMFAACLRHDLAAAVLFYPSQPTFDELGVTKPVHAVDLLWNISCPTLLLVGALDVVLTPDRLADLRRRADAWDVELTVALYPGAQHAFSAEGSSFFDRAADEQSWVDATAFLADRLGGVPA
jgi:carboxymethylenebutenolidase